MDFQEALQAKKQVADVLGIGGRRRRAPQPRVAVGLALTPQSNDFRIALRAWTHVELDRAFAKGREGAVRRAARAELDIRITGPIVAEIPAEQLRRESRLHIGASISHRRGGAGTLGFFARRVADGAPGIVSNNHVLALADHGNDGDEILHPALLDGGTDVVAFLDGGYPRLDVPEPIVDCAFARLRDNIAYDPVRIAEGLALKPGFVPLHDQREVLKCGRTTQLTRGRITAIALDRVDVEYADTVIFFNRQIEISPIDDAFTRPGDSGSLVVNPDGHPVGLSFCGTRDCRISYANPIADVLDSLGVTFQT